MGRGRGVTQLTTLTVQKLLIEKKIHGISPHRPSYTKTLPALKQKQAHNVTIAPQE